MDVLKEKIITVPILVFPNWKNEFYVHVDASFIDLGVVLTQIGEGDIDHPIGFAGRELSKAEKNYSTTKCRGLAMVYVLQKCKHYLLGAHFEMYRVQKPILGGKISRWLLLFKEYDFELIVKPGCLNAGPDHLSLIENGDEHTSMEEGLLGA